MFRNVHTTFWKDTKVVDDYTPEDKYFMLYALTNDYTNIIGCYEISIKQMSIDLGYSKDVIENLLKRFEQHHKTILYDCETKELLITHWYKYNWNKSPKLDNALYNAIEKVKSNKFHDILASVYNERESVKENDTLCIGYRYPVKTSITITNTITNSNSIDNVNIDLSIKERNIKERKEIIDYLNLRLGTHYKYTTKITNEKIEARFKEGFTVEDFKTVIDKKADEWLDTEKGIYLRPETLFGNKFESYLNQQGKKKELTTDDIAKNMDWERFLND